MSSQLLYVVMPLVCTMISCSEPVADDPDAPPPSLWQWPPSLFHAVQPPRRAERPRPMPQRAQTAEPVSLEAPELVPVPKPPVFISVPVGDLLGKGREAAVRALGSPDAILHSDDESRLVYSGPGCRVTLRYLPSTKDWHYHLIQVDGADGCRIAKKPG